MLPLLEAQAALRRGRGIPDPRRFVLVTFTNGVVKDQFFPKGDGDNLATLELPAITQPLDPYKSKLNFFANLELRNFTDHPGHGGAHENYCVVFTGRAGIPKDTGDSRYIPVVASGISIDQHIADGLSRRQRFAIPALHLGVLVDKLGGGEMQARNSFRDFGQPNSPEDNPHVVFADLFASSDKNRQSPEKRRQLLRLRAERRSLLDHVGTELQAFGRRLGAEDRPKVAAHLESVRDIERQLTAPPNASARACQTPDGTGLVGLDHNDVGKYPQLVELQTSLAVAALACDLTRVVTLQLTNGNGSGLIFSWLGIEGKGREFPVRDHHDVAHRPGDNNRDKIAVDRWFMERMAVALRKLTDVREGDRSLLDNSAVLWTNHMGNGGGHTSNHLPWVLAGSCGGAFRTGRYIRLAPRTATNGLYSALANAMGVPTPHFGEAHYGGPMGALLS